MIQGFGARLLRPGLPLLLAAAQIVTLVLLVKRFALRLPLSDHWIILGKLLTALERGDPLLPVLWSQHNEHRNFVGHVADLASVGLAGGDLRYEQYGLVALAAIAGVWLGLLAWRGLRQADPGLAPWAVPLLALLAMAPAQMETWVNAVQFPVVAQNVFVIGCLWALGRAPRDGRKLALAAGCALAATACYSHGLLVWPAALVPLIAQSGRRWKPVALGWLALSAAVWGAYFTNYVYPPKHPSLALRVSDIPDVLLAFAGILGNPLGAVIRPQHPWAGIVVPLIGAAGLALLGLALVRLRRRPAELACAWPWLGLAVYALLCAAAMAVGRYKFGFVAALSPRYITIVWPFWAATLTLLLLALAGPAGARAAEGARKLRGWTPARVALGLVIAAELGSINSQVQRWTPILRDRAAATRELPDVCLGNFALVERVGEPKEVSAYWSVLARHGLVTEAPPRLEFEPGARRAFSGAGIASVRWEEEPAVPTSERCLRIAGWAAPESKLGQAREVWLVSRGVALKGAWVGLLRPHAGQDYDADPRPETGWTLYVEARRLERAVRELDVYAVYAASPRAVWIGKVSR